MASATGPEWLLEDFSIDPLLSAGLSPSLLRAYFDTPRTYLIIKPGHSSADALLPKATKVLSFASFSAFQNAVISGAIPPDVHYILYDNESWSATPVAEQHAPITYAGQAEALAHAHGLRLIFTPAADLVPVLDREFSLANKYFGYLQLDLASQGAQRSDVFEIQAQQAEGTAMFATFAATAINQARAANPHAVLFLGLTTVTTQATVTAQTLLSAYDTTKNQVAGYWLNIPGGAGRGPQHPEVAVQFLEQLAPQLGISG